MSEPVQHVPPPGGTSKQAPGVCVVERTDAGHVVTRADEWVVFGHELVEELTGWPDGGHTGPIAVGTTGLGLGEVLYHHAGPAPAPHTGTLYRRAT